MFKVWKENKELKAEVLRLKYEIKASHGAISDFHERFKRVGIKEDTFRLQFQKEREASDHLRNLCTTKSNNTEKLSTSYEKLIEGVLTYILLQTDTESLRILINLLQSSWVSYIRFRGITGNDAYSSLVKANIKCLSEKYADNVSEWYKGGKQTLEQNDVKVLCSMCRELKPQYKMKPRGSETLFFCQDCIGEKAKG